VPALVSPARFVSIQSETLLRIDAYLGTRRLRSPSAIVLCWSLEGFGFDIPAFDVEHPGRSMVSNLQETF
jgi:hypothetical protein